MRKLSLLVANYVLAGVILNVIPLSGSFYRDMPFVLDLTDGAGHGILIATDQIFWQVFSNSFAAAIGVEVKIMYRMKNISLQEYIGIVQSQQ